MSIIQKALGQLADRIFLVLLIVAVIAGSWIGVAYADETISNVYVNPFGSYGEGSIWRIGSYDWYAKTRMTNGQSVYNIYVNARHFHGYLYLEHEAFDNKYNASTTSTVSYSTATWGNDTAQHFIRGIDSWPSTVFYTQGDFFWWYCGNSSC